MHGTEEQKAVNNWQCGMCLSCLQRDMCPDKSGGGRGCDNYIEPEPTRHEWPEIYRGALRKLKEAKNTFEEVSALGRANGIRDALIRIHGFTAEEVEEIEKGGL